MSLLVHYTAPGEMAPTEPREPKVLANCIACGTEIYADTELMSTPQGPVHIPTVERDARGHAHVQMECFEDWLLRHCSDDVRFTTGREYYGKG